MLTLVSGFIDTSKVQEPPETPAPVFALRAFKSALFGTPGAEEDETGRVSRGKEQPASLPRNESDSRKDPSGEGARNTTAARKTDIGQAGNTMASPTKSILVTPGTTSNRRKTVSFGDGVVDNERKQESPSKNSSSIAPTTLTPNTGSQWSSGSSDGKPRSKLTQALMDSRDKRSKDSERTQGLKPEETRFPGSTPKATTPSSGNYDNDDTINLNEPRSQSGKYWKTEFDNYRTRTDREIRRLVQYRSVAKAYARKKDEEAVRLAEKLKQEEDRVAEMERHVSQLASTMVAEESRADKEQLIQDLTKQTALALQYKHRVSLLRKALEQHGVVSSEFDDPKEHPEANNNSSDKNDKTAEELRKTQKALEQANAKIEEMKSQRLDLSELQDLAQSSEKKASELKKENFSMKQSLAKVKSEMTKYEGRRKEKETKLKQREAKLEIRIQEYRERLKTVSQQHRNSQESLKESFGEERQHLQEQIERLKLTIATLERLPKDIKTYSGHAPSPSKGYSGVQAFDFGQSSPQRGGDDETEDIDEPPSPSPRTKDRRYRQLRTIANDPLNLKRAAQAMGIEHDGYDDDDQLVYAQEESPQKTQDRRRRHTTQDNIDDPIPPSSPPDLASIEPSSYQKPSTRQDHDRNGHRTTYLPTSRGCHLADLEESQQISTQPRRRSPTKYGLDALSGISALNSKQRQGLAELSREGIPVERILAAQARLKQKGTNRRGKEDGKENIKAYNF